MCPCNMFLTCCISDPSGKLNFSGKAIIHADGVDFSNGNSFTIKMDDLILQEELGKGQYGTVQKVKHRVTNVTMAMKVCLNCLLQLSIIYSHVYCLGNPLRIGRNKTPSNFDGTRHFTQEFRRIYCRILWCILYRILCLLLYGVYGCWFS